MSTKNTPTWKNQNSGPFKWLPILYATVLNDSVEKILVLKKILKDNEENSLRIEKFIKDCALLEKILNETSKSLIENGSFEFLKNFNNAYEEKKRQDDEKMKMVAIKKHQLHELKMKYKIETTNTEIKIKELLINSGKIKDQIIDLTNEYRMKIEYLTSYEDQRYEENCLKNQKKLDNLNNLLKKYDMELIKETIINETIENYLNKDCNDHLIQIDCWIGKYNKDIKERNDRISEIKSKIQLLRDNYEALKLLYERREREINEYLKYKEEMQLAYEEEQKRNKAATKIQAWWRGTMYRKCLGPYKKKKGKRTSKNKNKTSGTKKRTS